MAAIQKDEGGSIHAVMVRRDGTRVEFHNGVPGPGVCWVCRASGAVTPGRNGHGLFCGNHLSDAQTAQVEVF